ncbi:MAG: hypothetical protein ACK55Z_08305, partial [bacterium]
MSGNCALQIHGAENPKWIARGKDLSGRDDNSRLQLQGGNHILPPLNDELENTATLEIAIITSGKNTFLREIASVTHPPP